MGCDIHCFVEKFKDGEWEQITGFLCDMYDPTSEIFSRESYRNAISPIESRNYSLFGLLANVRNGYGCAGCDTSDSIEPISFPKGLPDNLSNSVKKESESWGYDGHSHSWLTLKEILEYDTNKVKTKRGFTNLENFNLFVSKGRPISHYGGVWGKNVYKIIFNNSTKRFYTEKGFVVAAQFLRKREEEEVACYNVSNDIIASVNAIYNELLNSNPKAKLYIQIEWEVTVKEFAWVLYSLAVPQLKARSETSDYSDIRLVFWFDN